MSPLEFARVVIPLRQDLNPFRSSHYALVPNIWFIWPSLFPLPRQEPQLAVKMNNFKLSQQLGTFRIGQPVTVLQCRKKSMLLMTDRN